MPVSTTHNVDADDVLGEVPYETQYVTQSDSTPLCKDDIDGWIASASGILNALLTSRGFSPASLGDDEAEVLRAGVIAWAKAKTLSRLKADADEIRDARREYEDYRDVVRKMPQELGNSQTASMTVHSNVDPDAPTAKKWDSDSFGGW